MRSSAKKVAMEAKAKSRAAITLVEGGAERPGRLKTSSEHEAFRSTKRRSLRKPGTD